MFISLMSQPKITHDSELKRGLRPGQVRNVLLISRTKIAILHMITLLNNETLDDTPNGGYTLEKRSPRVE